VVEGVEELFLGPLSSGQIVDVIHEQHIDAAIFLPEIQNLSVLEMVDQVIHELFRGDIQDLETTIVFEDMVSDGVHEMSFTQAGTAVDIKRIVGLGGIFHHGRSGGMRELVAGAHHKVFKGVIGIEVGIEEGAVFRTALIGRSPHKGRRGVFKDVFDVIHLVIKLAGTAIDKAGVMKGKPVFEI
jgi:hypothetical protein